MGDVENNILDRALGESRLREELATLSFFSRHESRPQLLYPTLKVQP